MDQANQICCRLDELKRIRFNGAYSPTNPATRTTAVKRALSYPKMVHRQLELVHRQLNVHRQLELVPPQKFLQIYGINSECPILLLQAILSVKFYSKQISAEQRNTLLLSILVQGPPSFILHCATAPRKARQRLPTERDRERS